MHLYQQCHVLGLVMGKFSVINHGVMALVKVKKKVLGLYFLYYLEYHDKTSDKMIDAIKALYKL